MNFNHNFDAATADLPFLDETLTGCLLLLLAFTLLSLFRFYWGAYRLRGAGLTAVIAALVGLVLNIYFMSSIEGPRIWLGFLFSCILALGVFHPGLALANTAALLIIRPWELLPLESSFSVLPRGVFIVFLISFTLHILRVGELKFKWNRNLTVLLMLLGWVFLSTFVTGRAGESQADFFATYFRSVVVGLLILVGVQSKEDSRVLQGAIVIAVLGLSLFALLNTSVLEADRLEGRGAIQNANDLAAILIMVVPLALSLLLRGQVHFYALIPSGILVFILGLGVWKAQSRAAYLALICMFLAWIFSRYRQQRGLLVKLLVVGILAAGALSQVSLGRNSSDLEESQMNRLGYWKAGASMTLRSPVFGVGYGEFANNYSRYGAADFTEHGKRTAHSSWILLMSETGFPGLFLMLTFAWFVALKAWRLAPERPEFLLAVVGYGICMSFLSHIYTIYPYLLAGLILSYPESKAEEGLT